MVNAPSRPRPAPPAPSPDPYADQRSQRYLDVLLDIGFAVDRILEKRLAGLALSTAQLRLLELVASRPGINPGEIAGIMLQQSHSVSGLLNRLEDRGLITRERGGREDRRLTLVNLTSIGVEVTAEGVAIRDKLEGEVEAMGFGMKNDALTFRAKLVAALSGSFTMTSGGSIRPPSTGSGGLR